MSALAFVLALALLISPAIALVAAARASGNAQREENHESD